MLDMVLTALCENLTIANIASLLTIPTLQMKKPGSGEIR